MKRIVIPLLTLACLTAAYLGGHSQQPAPAQVLSSTKVGVVNLPVVCAKYDRITRFKTELDRDVILPFKEKKAELEKIIAKFTPLRSPARKEVDEETRENAARKILDAQRQLEDLEFSTNTELNKKVTQNLAVLDKELQSVLKTYAAANGYHMILAFGEPEVPFPGVKGFQCKMSVIDGGGLCLAYVGSEVDVTMDIVKTLNRQFEDEE